MYCSVKKIALHYINKYYKVKRFYNRLLESLTIPLKIDIHIVEHCNLNCKGCSHFSPLAKAEFIEIERFESSIKHLKKIEKFLGCVQLLGGEPLLHPQITDLLKIARKVLKKTKINIITNGILLNYDEKLPIDFWKTCIEQDILIKITRYPTHINYNNLITRLVKMGGVKYEIFDDKNELNRWGFFPLYKNGFNHWTTKFSIFKLYRCTSINCLQLVGDRLYPCCHIAYIRHYNNQFGEEFLVTDRDYIDLNKNISRAKIRKLMSIGVPFCKYCGFGYISTDWSISKKEQSEWSINK